MDVTISISKEDVLLNVATATAYTGHKAPDEGELYDRVVTHDVDRDKLEEFWEECNADIAEKFHGILVSQSGGEQNKWDILFDLPSNFSTSSKEGMRCTITRFYTNGIISKWFVYTNKGEAADYAARAAAHLASAHRLAFEKAKPIVPTYDEDE